MGLPFKIFKKALGILAGFVAIVILFIVGVFIWSAEKMCGNSEISTTPIPGTSYKIVVFERDCGATTGFSTQARIMKTSEKLKNREGNIFSADCNHGAAPSGPGGGPELQVKVISPRLIELSHHKDVRVFDSQASYRGIDIRYSTFSNR